MVKNLFILTISLLVGFHVQINSLRYNKRMHIRLYIHSCMQIIFLFTHINIFLWTYENLKSNCSLKVSKYIGNSPIFVAGGTRGIGLEVVKQLSLLGTPVHCLARDPVFTYFYFCAYLHIYRSMNIFVCIASSCQLSPLSTLVHILLNSTWMF